MTEVASSGTGGDWLPRSLRLVRAGATRKSDPSWLKPVDPRSRLVFLRRCAFAHRGRFENDCTAGEHPNLIGFNVPRRCHDLSVQIKKNRLPARQKTPAPPMPLPLVTCRTSSAAADDPIDLLQSARAKQLTSKDSYNAESFPTGPYRPVRQSRHGSVQGTSAGPFLRHHDHVPSLRPPKARKPASLRTVSNHRRSRCLDARIVFCGTTWLARLVTQQHRGNIDLYNPCPKAG